MNAAYSRPAIWLHWIVAALMLCNVGLGLYAGIAPEIWTRWLYDTHKSLGVTILGFVVLRLSWRLSHPPPPLPASYRAWERHAARAAHIALYVVMFALPLSGWAQDSAWKGLEAHPMRWFGLFPWPPIAALAGLPPALKQQWHDGLEQAHIYLGFALYALVVAHIAGALKHQFIDGRPEMRRMTGR